MGLGPGKNNYVEFNSLRLLLPFAWEKICNKIQIFGDSKVIINWFNNEAQCPIHTVRSLLDEVLALKYFFDFITITHIYS